MNVSTGRIGTMEDLLDEGANPADLIAIQHEQVSARQEADGYVALNDRKTGLGRLRASHDPLTKNQEKRRRRQLRKCRA